MLEVLTKSFLSTKDAAFYDLKAKSHQELLANFHAKVNECVKEINDFTESISKKYDEFLAADEKSKQEHMTAIRQEFQDFIDIIDLKILEMNLNYKTFTDSVNKEIADQNNRIANAENYMRNNIISTTREVLTSELHSLNIDVETTYNEELKEVNFVFVNRGDE